MAATLRVRGDALGFVEEELNALCIWDDASPFCADAAAAIRRGSPTAAAVTLEAVRRARGAKLDDVLRTDFRVMTNMVRPSTLSADFYEGVRAALVDKDRSPAWRPAAIDVAGYFEAPGDGFEDLVL